VIGQLAQPGCSFLTRQDALGRCLDQLIAHATILARTRLKP
jgi:hypothetical protein